MFCPAICFALRTRWGRNEAAGCIRNSRRRKGLKLLVAVSDPETNGEKVTRLLHPVEIETSSAGIPIRSGRTPGAMKSKLSDS